MSQLPIGDPQPIRPTSLPPRTGVPNGTHEPVEARQASSREPAEPVRVSAQGADLGQVVWRGLFLTIITLGIYRFWYRTDLRRWYWRHTAIGLDTFEYRGTARELLLGFLVALAITLPLTFAGALVAVFVANESLANAVTVSGVVIVGFLAQYGAYRARRFQLNRTVWRGLRFDLAGSPWRYALVSAGWLILTVLSLGILLPLMRRALERLKIANMRFGTAEGRFSARAATLMLRWALVWLPTAGLTVAALVTFAAAGTEEGDAFTQMEAGAAAFGFTILAVVMFLLLWPFYRAAEFRHFTASSAIGPVSFSSDLRALSLFGIYVRFAVLVGVMLTVLGLGGLLLLGFFASTAGGGLQMASAGAGVLASGAGVYLLGVYLFMAAKELIVAKGFWHHAMGSITVTGLDGLSDIFGTPLTEDSALGEGLADALDFGGV